MRGFRVGGFRVGTEGPDPPPPPPPPKSHKHIGFLSNTGPDLLKNDKATKPAMLGHRWHASETPFKWRFAGGPMMVRLK